MTRKYTRLSTLTVAVWLISSTEVQGFNDFFTNLHFNALTFAFMLAIIAATITVYAIEKFLDTPTIDWRTATAISTILVGFYTFIIQFVLTLK